MTRYSSTLRRLAVSGSALTALLMLEGCPGASLYNARELIGFPTTALGMGTPNGVADDAGWTNGFTKFLEDGSSSPAAFMRGVADANHVYLYVEAEDSKFDSDDAVIVAFNPTGDNNKFMRLHIYPCRLSGGGVCPDTGAVPDTNLTPSVEFETGTLNAGAVTWGAKSQSPAGVVVRSATAPNHVAGRWSVEIQLDRSTYPFLAKGTFGMFVDAISVNPGGFGMSASAVQYSWPLGSFVGANASDPPAQVAIDTAALPLPRWGTATLDTATLGTGLQITGFETTGADPSLISLTQPNEFIATLANSPDGSGGPDLTNATADFQINNIGLHPDWTWTGIPPTPIPNTPQTIHPQEYVSFSSGEWQLATTGNWQGSGKTEQQFFTDNPHQCIMVNAHNLGFTTSRQYNMNFVSVNSPFDMKPEIAMSAWRKNFPQATGVTLREEFFNAPDGFTWQTTLGGAEPAGPHSWLLRSFDKPVLHLKQSVLVDEKLTLPSTSYPLDAVSLSQGKTFDLDVKPGTVTTLLADGQAMLRGRPVSAGGIGDQAARRLQIETRHVPDSLRGGRGIQTGALVGSFDGFKSQFAIGNGTTFYVPADAGKLSVRFATRVPFDKGAFTLQSIATAPTPFSVNGANLDRLRNARLPILLPVGNNLPIHIVRGSLAVGKVIVIGGHSYPVGVPMGSYGSIIRHVRDGSGVPGQPGGPSGPGTPNVPGTVVTGTTVVPKGGSPTALHNTVTPIKPR
ncbi:hypothetical protein GCM10009087_47470 [Sphingomonas oligophenolica]|uniref:Carbohydrate-binding domain-containing protein n=1 Tax=Sphingomonas oligophenolica TaxID=301154 RepID=A0ABU9Y778_9SPHN